MFDVITNAQYTIHSAEFEPAYLALYRQGELQRRAEVALASLEECRVCPRHCMVNRLADRIATCKTGRYAQVSSFFAHRGEEDCLRGWQGSGTIFFSLCNLRCVFCQNFEVSQGEPDQEVTAAQLATIMLTLQAEGCHNINFVTPEHVVPQLLEALVIAIEQGLRLPLVYNTSAYDSMESMQWLEGVVDIYMPDFKMWTEDAAFRYLKAKDYPQIARQVITEMYRQVGPLTFDEQGLAKRGVLVRHLIMPGMSEETAQIIGFLADLMGGDAYLNLMAQYYPAGKVDSRRYREINRHLSQTEYLAALSMARKMGIRLDERRGYGW